MTVAKKIESLSEGHDTQVSITLNDVNSVCIDLFESKLKPIVKKLPKTHILLLWEIIDSQ